MSHPNKKSPRYVVIGHPIAHSLSPLIHRTFAEQHGIELQYDTLEVQPDLMPTIFKELQAQGVKGGNITAPLKEKACAYVDQLSERAKDAQAMNTFLFDEDGTLLGDNTDGVGFVRDMMVNQGVPMQDCNILILGAGGAARGILRPILELSPKKVVIANRSRPKALDLVEYFKPWGKVRFSPYEDLKKARFDVLIQATSAGFKGELPPLPESVGLDQTVCYDLNYGAASQNFLNWVKKRGALKIIDGLGMLVEQAAEAFYLWHHVRVDTGSVIRKLREHLLSTSTVKTEG